MPDINPDLPDWIRDHLRTYLESDGAEGHVWNGVPCLLLTTNGRKSGQPKQLPLIYGQDGDDYLLVASKGGDANHPSWYLNLDADPNVELQVGPDKFQATARTASADERGRVWSIMEAIWPAYNEYQANTQREIPVVVLTRV